MAAITTAEILRKYTTATGPGNSTAGAPGTSLGGFISTTAIPDNALNNLFDDVTGDENKALENEYRCEGVHNSNAANDLQNPVAWISAEVAGGASVAIGPDPTATSALGASAAQFVSVANEDTAPAGVAFSAPTTKGAGIGLGTIPKGNVKGLWHRRTTANSAALNNDGATVRVEGDTGAA